MSNVTAIKPSAVRDMQRPPRLPLVHRYRAAATRAALRSWRVARITAECIGWMLLAGAVAMVIS